MQIYEHQYVIYSLVT